MGIPGPGRFAGFRRVLVRGILAAAAGGGSAAALSARACVRACVRACGRALQLGIGTYDSNYYGIHGLRAVAQAATSFS